MKTTKTEVEWKPMPAESGNLSAIEQFRELGSKVLNITADQASNQSGNADFLDHFFPTTA